MVSIFISIAELWMQINLSNPNYPPLSSTPVVLSKRSSTPFAKRRRIELDNSLSVFGESS